MDEEKGQVPGELSRGQGLALPCFEALALLPHTPGPRPCLALLMCFGWLQRQPTNVAQTPDLDSIEKNSRLLTCVFAALNTEWMNRAHRSAE